MAEESLQAEEKVKNQLCQELNTLVQQVRCMPADSLWPHLTKPVTEHLPARGVNVQHLARADMLQL